MGGRCLYISRQPRCTPHSRYQRAPQLLIYRLDARSNDKMVAYHLLAIKLIRLRCGIGSSSRGSAAEAATLRRFAQPIPGIEGLDHSRIRSTGLRYIGSKRNIFRVARTATTGSSRRR